MADNNYGTTKIDAVLAKLDKLTQQNAALEKRIDAIAKSNSDAVIAKLTSCYENLRMEFSYLSTQIESIYNNEARALKRLSDDTNAIRSGGVRGGGGLAYDDMDELASRIAAKIVVPETAAADVDSDEIAERVAAKVGSGPAEEVVATTAVGDIDYDLLGSKIVEKLYLPNAVVEEIDYEKLAEKLSEAIPAPEVISPDYIACKVAEQIVLPDCGEGASAVDLDIEELSRKVADKIVIPAYDLSEVSVDEERLANAIAEKLREETVGEEETEEVVQTAIDEESLAENIANRLNISLSDELIADAVVRNLAGAIDSEEIADCVAKKVGSISPEQFDVIIDDDGCDSLASAVESKLDYDVISAAVAEKLNPAFYAAGMGNDIDTEELAQAISEKITVGADINEDVIADKAAAVLSNYLPEIDTDDIADKVVAGVLPAIPAAPVIDTEEISNSVSEKIVASQEDQDFDIVIDEEGLNRITESVSEEIKQENAARFDKVDEDIAAVKDEYSERFNKIDEDIATNKDETAARFDKVDGDIAANKEEATARFDKIDEDIAEIKRMLIGGVVALGATEIATAVATSQVVEEEPEEEIVTVSDVVVEDNAESENDEVIEEIVEDIDEDPTDGEVMPDGIPGISNGVDFASMMKYNRSFIARIIQGTDDVKQYYGQVKNALLSYKKVNSNIAWGAERFNKGRETIARFKIRGKTLCLYLALDPKEFETSVYHQVDVSDNKSMHGTPMMVKIKSPRGAKKAIRLIDIMLARRDGVKRNMVERDYAAMYPYETIEELIEDGLVKDVSKK